MLLDAMASVILRLISVLVVGSATCLVGCATTTPRARDMLTETRAILDDAQRQPSVDPAAVAEARAALEYAEREYEIAPDHPLNAHRARMARDLAARAGHR